MSGLHLFVEFSPFNQHRHGKHSNTLRMASRQPQLYRLLLRFLTISLQSQPGQVGAKVTTSQGNLNNQPQCYMKGNTESAGNDNEITTFAITEWDNQCTA